MNQARKVSSHYQDDFTEVLYGLQKDHKGFQSLATLLRNVAGINLRLNDKNLSLMAGRLIALMRKYEFKSYKEYVTALQRDTGMIYEFISRLTTNTTEFFRENPHFSILKDTIPRILDGKKGAESGELRIWCAACSTGQEAYSLAMTALEAKAEKLPFKLKMLATDIDFEVLDKAMTGAYTADEVKSVPAFYRQKYFDHVPADGHKRYVVKKHLREQIQFASFNLLTENYPFKRQFDIIFCRNVFIYFDRETSASILARIIKVLGPGGCLFLGHSESGMVRLPSLKAITHAVYSKV